MKNFERNESKLMAFIRFLVLARNGCPFDAPICRASDQIAVRQYFRRGKMLKIFFLLLPGVLFSFIHG